MTRYLVRRRRRERLTGIALAALGVAVLVIAVVALRSPNGHGVVAGQVTATPSATPKSSPKPSPTSTPTSKPPASSATSSRSAARKLPLVVLNNTAVVGLAERAKARFQAGGWKVSSLGNLTNTIVSTCAYYDPAAPGALAAARALQAQFPKVKRVAPKFAQLPAGPIVVVLTRDYS